jgi:hypothetical protein
MSRFVLSDREAGEVVQPIVGGVIVGVMDLATVRDGTVGLLPDLLMEASQAALTVCDTWGVVLAISPVGGVGVAAEEDPVEPYGLDVGHTNSLSEYRKASMRVQPFPHTQTGWSPVPVRAAPVDNSTR